MSNSELNFTDHIDADGADFPRCCESGYWMSYNTHLRDPMRTMASNKPAQRPESLVKREIATAKNPPQIAPSPL